MRSLMAALSFFTFFPIPGRRETAELDGWALGFAPLAGLIIGIGLMAFDALAGLIFPHPLRDALLVLAWIVLTGATHIDGLADSMDGLWATTTPQRRLEIMRDVNSGAFAVTGVAILLIVKTMAVAEVAEREGWLLATPVVARMGMLLVMRIFPYGRKEGLGAGLREQLTVGPLSLAGLTTALVMWRVVLVSGWETVLVVSAIGLAGALLFGWWACRRLQVGLTGDIYGATVELAEIAILLAVVGSM